MAVSSKQKWLKYVSVALVVVGLVGLPLLIGQFVDFKELLTPWLEKIRASGVWGLVFFIIIYMVATILFLPATLFTLAAGILFGVLKGSLVVWVGATLGAIAAFGVSRLGIRKWIEKKYHANKKFQALDKAVGEKGWKIVGLTRLSPIFPFNLLNYLYGATSVSFADYSLASTVGIIPGVVVYVYLGSLAGSLANLATSRASNSKLEWGVRIGGFVIGAAVSAYIVWMARQALRKELKHETQ